MAKNKPMIADSLWAYDFQEKTHLKNKKLCWFHRVQWVECLQRPACTRDFTECVIAKFTRFLQMCASRGTNQLCSGPSCKWRMKIHFVHILRGHLVMDLNCLIRHSLLSDSDGKRANSQRWIDNILHRVVAFIHQSHLEMSRRLQYERFKQHHSANHFSLCSWYSIGHPTYNCACTLGWSQYLQVSWGILGVLSPFCRLSAHTTSYLLR